MSRACFFTTLIVWGLLLSSISFGSSGWVAGQSGNALSFDGLDDYVEVTGYSGIGGSNARTVSLWIKTSAIGSPQALVQWGSDSAGQLWMLRVQTNGTMVVAVYDGGVISSRSVTDNQWHHIAAVLDEGQTDPTQIRLYIDGQLDAVPTGSGTINTTQNVPVHLGVWCNPRAFVGLSNYFSGLMDEVCIYNRALDAGEIVPANPIPTEGLIAHWAMDETVGFIAHDTVSSYNGILKNMPQGYSGGNGTSWNPYKITTKADLLALAGITVDYSKSFILTADIDLEGQNFPLAIIAPDTNNSNSSFDGTAFTGIFNGNGHKIVHFNISGGNNNYVGLFGYVGRGGQIKYLGIEDCIVSGNADIGGLAGYNYYGSISQCYSTGAVSGSSRVGGLVGVNSQGTISQCYSTAAASGSFIIGGLAGDNEGIITDCYSTGAVNGPGLYSGGLVGDGGSGVKNGFWDTATSGQTTSAGGTGKTTAEMKTQATFAGIGPVTGRIGKALYFDGESGHVEMSDYYGIGGAGARTVSLWVMTSTTGRIQTLVQWGDDTAGKLWLMRLLENGMVQVALYGGGVHSVKSVNDGQWHQIIAVLDEGQTDPAQVRLYIDGFQDNVSYITSSSIDTSQTVPVRLGVYYQSSNRNLSNYFKGLMDDLCVYDRALDVSEIAPVEYAAGLAAHWKLDESDGATVQDSAGSWDGVLHNMVDSGWVAGRTGNALAFDGKNDYVDIPTYMGIGGAGARTVSLWVKTSVCSQIPTLIQWGSDATGQLWLMRIQANGTVAVAAYGGGVQSGRIVTDNQWHRITAVLDDGQIDSSQIHLYIDGQFDTAGFAGACAVDTSMTVPVHLGAWYKPSTGGLSNYFAGLMDDVCIYNRALGVSEIVPGDTIAMNGLVAHWKLDESQGTTAYDSAGYQNGVLHNIRANCWVVGRTGNALNFDGTDDYIDIPTYMGIGGSGGRTVSLWVKTSSSQTQTLVQWGSDSIGQLWMLRMQTNGTVAVAAYGGGVQSSQTINDGQWHYIMAVLSEGQTNSNQIRLYVDDQLDAVATVFCTINTSQAVPVHLGVWYKPSNDSLSNYFMGMMDDVCIYDRALDGSEIAGVQYASGMVNHWKLDESQGVTVSDSIGLCDGVLHSTSNNGWIAGRTGNSLSFNGTDDYVDTPTCRGIGGSGGRTVSLWVKTSSSQMQTLVQWGADTSGQLWLIRILSDGKVQVAVYGGGVRNTRSVADGQWHYIAVMLDEGQTDPASIRLYVDGVQDNVNYLSTCSINTSQTVPVHLGVWYHTSTGGLSGYFQGLMDDICIYGRALDIDEILPEVPILANGLIARWTMDDIKDTVVHDAISSHDGVLKSSGWDFYPTWIDGDPQDWILPEDGTGYPILRWQCPPTYSGGSGTAEDPYQIADANDILSLADARWDWDKYFILTGDIDMGEMVFPNAIIAPGGTEINILQGSVGDSLGGFVGTFNGNGHRITNFTIDSAGGGNIGLFGYVASGGVIKNLGLENCIISGASGLYYTYTGSLAGYNAGMINQCYSTGTVSGSYYVGGLVGYNSGSIRQCYSTGQLSATGNTGYKGGLLGYNYRRSGTVTACFWDILSSGQATSAGGIGKTTAQMKMLLTFISAGWDFVNETANGTEDIWFIREGQEYPNMTALYLLKKCGDVCR